MSRGTTIPREERTNDWCFEGVDLLSRYPCMYPLRCLPTSFDSESPFSCHSTLTAVFLRIVAGECMTSPR